MVVADLQSVAILAERKKEIEPFGSTRIQMRDNSRRMPVISDDTHHRSCRREVSVFVSYTVVHP